MSAHTHTRTRKSLGQHWLTDRRFLRRIANAADFTENDSVIEIGAGTGLLTSLLAERASQLTAVELDPRLATTLRERFQDTSNVSIVEADVMEAPLDTLLSHGHLPYVVIGNLPYYIGTAIVRKFLTAPVPPRWMIVTLQAEVADNIAAADGKMTYLAVETQIFARPRILFRLPSRAFKPPPRVHSAVLRLDVLDVPEIEVDDRSSFFELVHAGFAAPRKRIRNSLAIGLQTTTANAEALLEEASVESTVRPSELALENWKRLYFAHRRHTAA